MNDLRCGRCNKVLTEHTPMPRPKDPKDQPHAHACCGFVYPNPGSDEALDQGCTCAVIDNCHGAGFPYGPGENKFWISGDCPLHALKDTQ